MKVIDFPQGSPEWLQARVGCVTSSRICDVIAKIRSGGEAAARRDYRAQTVAEILTGVPQDGTYVSAEMQWGLDQEPIAVSAYEIETDCLTDEVGLVMHPTIARAGASPDRLVGEDGLLEVKCPKTATHLTYLLDALIPREYEPQMMWQMACTDRAWCDFVSFDPRLPEKMRLLHKRLHRNEKRIAELEREVLAFLDDVDRALETLRRFAA